MHGTKSRFDPASAPVVVVAIELPRSVRDECRKFAAARGQSLEQWGYEALQASLDYERNEALVAPPAKPARGKR